MDYLLTGEQPVRKYMTANVAVAPSATGSELQEALAKPFGALLQTRLHSEPVHLLLLVGGSPAQQHPVHAENTLAQLTAQHGEVRFAWADAASHPLQLTYAGVGLAPRAERSVLAPRALSCSAVAAHFLASVGCPLCPERSGRHALHSTAAVELGVAPSGAAAAPDCSRAERLLLTDKRPLSVCMPVACKFGAAAPLVLHADPRWTVAHFYAQHTLRSGAPELRPVFRSGAEQLGTAVGAQTQLGALPWELGATLCFAGNFAAARLLIETQHGSTASQLFCDRAVSIAQLLAGLCYAPRVELCALGPFADEPQWRALRGAEAIGSLDWGAERFLRIAGRHRWVPYYLRAPEPWSGRWVRQEDLAAPLEPLDADCQVDRDVASDDPSLNLQAWYGSGAFVLPSAAQVAAWCGKE